jgi:hypothetical protein
MIVNLNIVLPLRRLRSGVVHWVPVPTEEIIREGTVYGSITELVRGPIVARCGASLRGRLVVMHTRATCQRCRRLET